MPKLYFFGIGIKRNIQNAYESKAPYITDHLGGSFKAYIRSRNRSELVGKLKNNLDADSRRTVDVIVERVLSYPDEKDKGHINGFDHLVGGQLPVETDAEKLILQNSIRKIKVEVDLSPSHYDESVFHYHHGLKFLPRSIYEYIADTDFIDCGAFIGDSAIALAAYNYRKIYSIEMSGKSIDRYTMNLDKNGIPKSKYQIIQYGISSRDDLEPVVLTDTGSAGFSLFRNNSQYDHIEVELKTLDYITKKYDIQPGFIKADIEGAALKMVQGGVETFKKNRPVFSIAIYHNPQEFFEVKPFLEEILEDYTFSVMKLESAVEKNFCHSEIVLLGYPNEALRTEGTI